MPHIERLQMTFLKFKTFFGHELYHPSAVLTQILGFPPFTIIQETPAEPVACQVLSFPDAD